MKDKVFNYIKKYRMIEDGEKIVAGISGGADSAALFHLLREYRELQDYELYVVHVHHGLRGAEADRDEEFVRRLCRFYDIPYAACFYDVKALARQWGMSTEEAGRKARLEAFEAQKEAWGADKIALAHHQNDQAETMLHHLCRGSGLRGLRGILPVQGDKIRPLLCAERKEIEDYLRSYHFSWVTDSSNGEEIYTRNRIRKNILPLMESQVNEKTVSHMAKTAEMLSKIDDYLSRQAAELLCRCSSKEEGRFHLCEAFFREEELLQELALLDWLEASCHGRRDVTAGQIGKLLQMKRQPVGKIVQLPGGFQAVRSYDGIFLEKREQEDCSPEKKEGFERELLISGETQIPSGTIKTRIFPYFGQDIPQKTYTKWLNYDKIDVLLQCRTRRPGDYLAVNEKGGRKKLKDYLIDSKIPREWRGSLPLIAAGSEILWIVGHRLSEAYKIDESTSQVLEIVYEGGKSDGRKNQCFNK